MIAVQPHTGCLIIKIDQATVRERRVACDLTPHIKDFARNGGPSHARRMTRCILITRSGCGPPDTSRRSHSDRHLTTGWRLWPHQWCRLNDASDCLDQLPLCANIQCSFIDMKAPNAQSRSHYHFPSNFGAFIQGAALAAPYTPPYIRCELGCLSVDALHLGIEAWMPDIGSAPHDIAGKRG